MRYSELVPGKKGQAEHLFSDVVPGILLIIVAFIAIGAAGRQEESRAVVGLDVAEKEVYAERLAVNYLGSFVEHDGKKMTMEDLINMGYLGKLGREWFKIVDGKSRELFGDVEGCFEIYFPLLELEDIGVRKGERFFYCSDEMRARAIGSFRPVYGGAGEYPRQKVVWPFYVADGSVKMLEIGVFY